MEHSRGDRHLLRHLLPRATGCREVSFRERIRVATITIPTPISISSLAVIRRVLASSVIFPGVPEEVRQEMRVRKSSPGWVCDPVSPSRFIRLSISRARSSSFLAFSFRFYTFRQFFFKFVLCTDKFQVARLYSLVFILLYHHHHLCLSTSFCCCFSLALLLLFMSSVHLHDLYLVSAVALIPLFPFQFLRPSRADMVLVTSPLHHTTSELALRRVSVEQFGG